MNELYDKVEEFVRQSFTKDGKLTTRGIHSLRTKEWLLKIDPQASEILQIASVAHDIDSAHIEYSGYGSFRDPEYLELHQTEAAKTVSEFLIKAGTNEAIVAKVSHLVSSHEVGGDEEQNLIMDADSLSFFDRDMLEFLNRHIITGADKETVRDKINWMYNRITSEKAKRLAKPMYEDAIKLLENL